MGPGVAVEAYGAFAYAYDKALGQRFFRAVQRLLDETLDRYPTPKRTHLDLACGTGLVLKAFRERGWRSTGVDASLAMLQVAQRRVPRVAAGDLRALPLRSKFARITCLYDSLNHMLDANDLAAAFRSVRTVMDHDSLFLFDVNHPEIYPEVWGISEPFIAKGHDYHLEIATTYRSREKIGRAAVTGWADIGGKRVPIDEQHRQRAYSEREIVKALDAAGMAPVDVIDFDPYGEAEAVNAATVKLFFVCRPK
ncbi:MAG TPA: methyltransferase domain-containing protein [Thermoanaerobaculia bacterium]|nr:methyltransferase domain-containing protein [Thermoanaerobaculia bacterium]